MKNKRRWIVTAAALVSTLFLFSGCAGMGASKWKSYLGAWAMPGWPAQQMEITPNGETFLLRVYDSNFFGRNGGNGLASMRARLGEIGGALTIDSAPDRGTRISFTLPLQAGTEPLPTLVS